MGKMKDKRSVRVVEKGNVVGPLSQGGSDLDWAEVWWLYILPRGSSCKDSSCLGKWEFNGAGPHRETRWEVLRVQDRLEDHVWERQEPNRTQADWAIGTTAMASWPQEAVLSTCWPTINSSFSPCSICLRLNPRGRSPWLSTGHRSQVGRGRLWWR